jgi:DNA-directed RNA polymerase specialized sigma subunit, sigma24 homolog
MTQLNNLFNSASSLDPDELSSRFLAICYDELFEKVHSIASRYARTNALDLTHDIFLKFSRLQIQKLVALDYLDRYLLKVARNYAVTYCKRARKHIGNGIPECIYDNQKSIETKIDIDASLARLTERQLFAIKKQMEGYKIKEISSMLNSPEGAVKNLIFYGKKKIRKYLDDLR